LKERRVLGAALAVAFDAACLAHAAGVTVLEPVRVNERQSGAPTIADSASEGEVSSREIAARPIYRSADLLESVPGLIVTQHSGEGKANQYFLRGFNLDHGTDLAITVDGVPVNQRTHAHGQGYSDLNFVIPELVGGVRYRKGPYYAEEGDFAAAGAARLQLHRHLDAGIAEATAGGFGYRRALLADSPAAAGGRVLYALELVHNDGPWTRPDDLHKLNALLRYSGGSAANGFDVTAMAYRGRWSSTDQIPRRAVESQQLGRYDAVDPTDGGRSQRYSLSASLRRTDGATATRADAYVVRSDLRLFSNFTYFLRDPLSGDQMEQRDSRVTSGANFERTWLGSVGGREVEARVGAQLRNDDISIGLFNTRAKERLSTTRDDRVVESSAGVYLQGSAQVAPALRALAGIRSDFYRADVASDGPANAGKVNESLASPKLGLVLGPWSATEYYLSYGRGFHSNDARGSTITVDPASGAPAQATPLLVRATGFEAGVRSAALPGLQTTLALFRLDFDSELVFVGDAGTTEPTRPSRRVGVELSNAIAATSWLRVDADVAYTRARFTDADALGARIPGAVEGVATLTAAVDHAGPYYGSIRLRYFGPRPLIEDNSVRSASTTLVSARAGYKLGRSLRAQLDVFNVFDRRSSQIDYFYESRLRGEAAPVSDVHFHPVERRSLRASLIAGF
jgi:outer membrane cobalamin receptor